MRKTKITILVRVLYTYRKYIKYNYKKFRIQNSNVRYTELLYNYLF